MKTADFLPFANALSLARKQILEKGINRNVERIKKRHQFFQELIDCHNINALIGHLIEQYHHIGYPYFESIQQHYGFGLFEGDIPNKQLCYLARLPSIVGVNNNLDYYKKSIMSAHLEFMFPEQIGDITFDRANLQHLNGLNVLYREIAQAPWVHVIAAAGSAIATRNTSRGPEGSYIEYARMRFMLTPTTLHIAGPNHPQYLCNGLREPSGEGFWFRSPLKNLNVNEVVDTLNKIHYNKLDRGVYVGEVGRSYPLVYTN